MILSQMGTNLVKISQNETKFVVPEKIKIISKEAAEKCNLEEVIFPDNLEIIGERAFRGNKLKEIIIKNNCILDDCAFTNNSLLTKIDVASKNMSGWCFSYCGYENTGIDVTLNNATTIGRYAFVGSKIRSLEMPKVEHIENSAFERVEFLFDELRLPNTLKTIGNGAFTMCNLKDIYLPNSIENIDNLPYSDIKIHMTQNIFDRLKIEKTENIIIDAIEELLETNTFKQLNQKVLNKEVFII